MKPNILLIFAKHPEVQPVKTRINFGSEESNREFALTCINDLLSNVKGYSYDSLFVTDSKKEKDLFKVQTGLEGINLRELTHSRDVSSKFEAVFRELLNSRGYRKAVLIPTDLPFLNCGQINSAFDNLDKYRYVYGPEINGGVYLIGMKSYYKNGIFANVRWSTENSFLDLINNSGKENSSILESLNDFNTLEDIYARLPLISRDCPALHRYLQAKLDLIGVVK